MTQASFLMHVHGLVYFIYKRGRACIVMLWCVLSVFPSPNGLVWVGHVIYKCYLPKRTRHGDIWKSILKEGLAEDEVNLHARKSYAVPIKKPSWSESLFCMILKRMSWIWHKLIDQMIHMNLWNMLALIHTKEASYCCTFVCFGFSVEIAMKIVTQQSIKHSLLASRSKGFSRSKRNPFPFLSIPQLPLWSCFIFF